MSQKLDNAIAKYFILGTLATCSATVFLGAIVFKPIRTVCAIEVRMTDGNVYRPSVADTCAEAWQGFKFESLAGRDYDSVIAIAVDE